MNCPVADDGIRGKNEKYGENPKLVQVVDLLRSGNEPLNRDKDKASDSRRIHTHSSVSKPTCGADIKCELLPCDKVVAYLP